MLWLLFVEEGDVFEHHSDSEYTESLITYDCHHLGSQDHHPSKNSMEKTICCSLTSDAPDDRRMYPKHVELRTHQ